LEKGVFLLFSKLKQQQQQQQQQVVASEQLLDEVEQNIVPVAIRSFLAETNG